MNARRGRDVANLSPGTVLVAGSTGWRYRVQAADQEADRVVLRGPYGSLSSATMSFSAASQTGGSECEHRRSPRKLFQYLRHRNQSPLVDARLSLIA
jgi:hypothetical protein